MISLQNSTVVLVSYMANNQTVINTTEGMFFQSYSTLIAFKPKDGSTASVTKDWNCSATTLNYLKQFLGLNSYTKKQIQTMVSDDSLILVQSLA